MNQSLQMDVKRWRKAAKGLERELRTAQVQGEETIQGLDEQLEARDKEIQELHERLRKRQAPASHDTSRETVLQNELENARLMLQETNDELERLHAALEACQMPRSSTSTGHRSQSNERTQELERQNQELMKRLEDSNNAIEERDQVIENLEDTVESLRLDVEHMDHERQRAAQERSESRAEMFEEREERETLLEVSNYFPYIGPSRRYHN